MCEGIDGVTAAYYHSIQRVQLYGIEPCLSIFRVLLVHKKITILEVY